jgi:adenosine deaminase
VESPVAGSANIDTRGAFCPVLISASTPPAYEARRAAPAQSEWSGDGSEEITTLAGLNRPTITELQNTPKVVLHDHLDGGLRPQTLVELAGECGYRDLPSTEPAELAAAIRAEAAQGSLPAYLETFRHTLAVLQTEDALTRMASEAAADLAADGVVYAEFRFAPAAHRQRGLDLDRVIEAVLTGLHDHRRDIETGLICTSLRQFDQSLEVVEAALRHRDDGVVAVDLAGPEEGYPVEHHAAAIALARRSGIGITLHAGEVSGLQSIAGAVSLGATRIGHGIRITEDLDVAADGTASLGPLATKLMENGITLEVCPSSNVHIGAVPSFAEHPITTLLRAGLRVTVNTDNRLMSGVSVSGELAALVEHHGWGWPEVETVTVNAIAASFASPGRKEHLAATVVGPWFENTR